MMGMLHLRKHDLSVYTYYGELAISYNTYNNNNSTQLDPHAQRIM